ncbi:MAG: lysine--tRNA ligase [Planctomycetes bacterium]|nr:lysine--tRNA ligase [Planctomycetota bacterium]
MTELAHPDRLQKLAALRAKGRDPFPARGVEHEPIAGLIAAGGTLEAPGPRLGTKACIAGRLLTVRDFGKLMFAPVLDRTAKIQVGFQKTRLEGWWEERKLLDGGDQVAIRGELGRTQKGELTVWADEVLLLAKTLAAPPEKWHGLVDVEQRYRRRYVDLWASEGVREVFVLRSNMISLIRRFLEARGFLEVETPTLHPIAGGATAKPFVTHHNALDSDFYLRIAPELYLKRLIVGGLERVFEVSRNFRNEGISTRHNPEFTMLELYQAQADFRHMMAHTEELLEHLARTLLGRTALEFRGKPYELKAPFQRRRYDELFREANGCELLDRTAVARRAQELGITLPPRPGASAEAHHWALATEIFDHTVEPLLEGPVFVTHFPTPISPLAKCDPADARYTERFELFLGGMELANAFSELNDPQEQQRRFEEQVASKDPEAPGEVDLDYVQALEYGMPPTGGLGIGLDRLAMVLANQNSIRDVLLFPTLRPQHSS